VRQGAGFTHVCHGGSETAAETVTIYAAGSLKSALTDLAESYEGASGNTVSAKYGASGLLKDEISRGAKADVFASANMEHPQALHDQNKSSPVIRFARKSQSLVLPHFAIGERLCPGDGPGNLEACGSHHWLSRLHY